MILSLQTSFLARTFGEQKTIELFARAGFDAIDYSLFDNMLDPNHPVRSENYLDFARQLKKEAAKHGLFFNQAHAPHPTFKENDDAYNRMIWPLITRSVEIAGVLGARSIVVHPFSLTAREKEKPSNIAQYNKLIPLCQQYDIKIALENMWLYDRQNKRYYGGVCSSPQSFNDYLDALDPQYFIACLDVGHCGLIGQDPVAMIQNLGGKRLKALHIHDNDYKSDQHTAPFLGRLDWQTISKALADIGYSGDLTLESDKFLHGFPPSFVPQALTFLSQIGRQLIRMIEAAR